ncbi:hypothetical protein P167DRAFT_275368 [Morchella conica CCBAS932]|uniref:Uncharacterized protein n=1 Tax=Morchella conica CCBAS932 TaxID=1392247 RepID=A0A3N4KWF5_9PEZI|nr:hypothetical protein P167DRAFT_275368 [Morchella conica CCBAS932]
MAFRLSIEVGENPPCQKKPPPPAKIGCLTLLQLPHRRKKVTDHIAPWESVRANIQAWLEQPTPKKTTRHFFNNLCKYSPQFTYRVFPGQIWTHVQFFLLMASMELHQAFLAALTASIWARNRERGGPWRGVFPGQNRVQLLISDRFSTLLACTAYSSRVETSNLEISLNLYFTLPYFT